MSATSTLNVVITGSTKGIGLGLAQEFLKRGHNVAISGRSDASIATALTQLNSGSAKAIGISCEVSNFEQVQQLWDKASKAFGHIDIWVNNAGLARTAWSIIDIPHSEVEAMVTTNMLGTINGARVAAVGMLAQQRAGKIFNMLGGGSDGEYFPGMGIYGTTKRGLNYFCDALTKELKDSDILVGKIRPGMIVTDAVIREAQTAPATFKKSRNFMNNLVDQVETVSPFLVDEIIVFKKSGGKIAWLNGRKIAMRLLKARFKPREDQFVRFGL